ncbi:MAG: phage tail protein, partial [Eubacteriales bacterium]|nr:phage tail protein [Eubacteriales bacterium]
MREEIDIRLPRLMDPSLNEKARLRTAKVGYTLNNTPLSTATLTMSRGEATATVGDFVELYETYGSIGIFRVTDVETVYTPGLWARLLQAVGLKDVKVNLTLKHALCTIEDGCVFGYHEYGGTGVKLQSVLEKLMAFQPVARWQLGQVDFETEFQYSFENESNLLDAILSTAEPLTGEHVWTCDFTTTPWTLGLMAARTDDVCEMRMNRNISTVKVEVDRSTLCTRLYPLGYGEGVNQLTIVDVNGGVKYLDDAEAQAAWGIVAQPYVDTTITSAATLKAVSQAKLDILKNPTITVTVTGIDLSSLTGEPLDRLYPGRMCRVPLPDYGITVNERIISVKKDDVYGGNTRATITLANQKADAVNDIANLVRKAQINELYSQGATNQYALQFADNADSSHPAELSFYIDKNAVNINSVMCRYKLQ